MIANQVAGLLGGGAPPAPLGNFESIASNTATGGSSVTFSSIASTYKHLQVRILAKTTADYIDFRMTANSTTSGYSSHFMARNGSSVAATAYTSANAIRLDSGYGFGLTSFGYSTFVIDILDYANTSKNKTFRMLAGADYNTTGGEIYFGSGLWNNTAAIDTLKFEAISGTFGNPSYFALYGVK